MGGISGGFLFYHSSYTWYLERGTLLTFWQGTLTFILNWIVSNTQWTFTLMRPRLFQKGIVRIRSHVISEGYSEDTELSYIIKRLSSTSNQQGRYPSQSLPLGWEQAKTLLDWHSTSPFVYSPWANAFENPSGQPWLFTCRPSWKRSDPIECF